MSEIDYKYVAKTLSVCSTLWEKRALLAEKVISESPCDPDITTSQMAATKEHNEFIKSNFDQNSRPKYRVWAIGTSEAEGDQLIDLGEATFDATEIFKTDTPLSVKLDNDEIVRTNL